MPRLRKMLRNFNEETTGDRKETFPLSCIFMHKGLHHKYHFMQRSRVGLVYSHWNQKVSKNLNLIGCCALTLFSFSPVPYSSLSPPHMHVYTCVQARTDKHSETQLNLCYHPPANWHQLFSCILTHAYTLLSQSFVCKVAGCDGLLWLLLPGYVTRSSKLLYLLFLPM